MGLVVRGKKIKGGIVIGGKKIKGGAVRNGKQFWPVGYPPGSFFVLDATNRQIKLWHVTDGQNTGFAPVSLGSGYFEGLAASPDRLYVWNRTTHVPSTGTNRGTVRVYQHDGTRMTAEEFTYNRALEDMSWRNGELWIAENSNESIQRRNLSTNVTTTFVSAPTEHANRGMALTATRVYWAARSINTRRTAVYNYSGVRIPSEERFGIGDKFFVYGGRVYYGSETRTNITVSTITGTRVASADIAMGFGVNGLQIASIE